MTGILSWALPLLCTVMFYGLAGGMWKTVNLLAPQFCVLFFVIKSFVNWGTWVANGRPKPFAPERRAFVRWALLGQAVNGIAWICYFTALSTGPAAIVQTITAAYTALTVILALIFLKERLVAIQVIGVAMVVGSSVMLGYSGGTEGGMGIWFYASLGTLASWGICTAIFKHAYNQEGANDTVFFLTNWVGVGLTVLPFGLMQKGTQLPETSRDLWLGILIVLLYSLGDLTLFAAINRGPASIVSPLSGLYPLPTIAYSALILHEVISTQQWVAVGVVLVALVLIVPAPDNPVLKLLGKAPEQPTEG